MESINKGSNFETLLSEVLSYINENFEEPFIGSTILASKAFILEDNALESDDLDGAVFEECAMSEALGNIDMDDLEAHLKYKDESYNEMLLRKIDEKGMSDADCYNKALINKSNFNKIKNVEGYRAKKNTVIALGLALELPYEEMNELLNKAGYAFTKSSKFDLIIEYCIKHELYNVLEINDILFAFDQELLGSNVRD